MRLFSRVQPLMKLEVDQKSSSCSGSTGMVSLRCVSVHDSSDGVSGSFLTVFALMRFLLRVYSLV